jgi:hypothetical protein
LTESVEPKIVEGVMTSANTGGLGGGKSPLAKTIEAAMAQAVQDAYTAGVTEPDEVRARMQAAREKAKADFAAGNLTG